MDPLHVANVVRCLLSALGVAANLLILYIIGRYRTIRTISNVYVANLAVADVSFCLLAFVQGVFSIRYQYFRGRLENLLDAYCQHANVTNSSANVTMSNAAKEYLQTVSNATAEYLQTNNCTWGNLEAEKLSSLIDAKLNYESTDLASSQSCDVGRVLAVFLACASIFLLTATAVERHQAVTRPLEHRLRRTQRKALLTCLLMWALAFLVAALDTVARNLVAGDWTFTYRSLFQCVYLMPDGAGSGHPYFWLALAIFFLMYAVPAGVMIPIYGRIFLTLRLPRPRAARASTSRTFAARASTSRTLHMLFVVTVFFLVCWLPFHVTSFTVRSYTDGESPFYAATALAILNSVINPFLYAFIGKNWRKHVRRVFCSSPCEEEDARTRYHSDARVSVDSIYGYRDSVISIDTDVTTPDVTTSTCYCITRV